MWVHINSLSILGASSGYRWAKPMRETICENYVFIFFNECVYVCECSFPCEFVCAHVCACPCSSEDDLRYHPEFLWDESLVGLEPGNWAGPTEEPWKPPSLNSPVPGFYMQTTIRSCLFFFERSVLGIEHRLSCSPGSALPTELSPQPKEYSALLLIDL